MSEMYDENGNLDKVEVGRRVRSGLAVVIALAVLVGGGWFASSKVYDKYIELRTTNDYIGTGKADVNVVIPPGTSLTQMGEILVDANVIRSTKAFRTAAAAEPKSQSIQAGTYKLKTEIPAATAVSMLLDPANRVVKRVTIPEGLRFTAMVPVLSKGTGIPEDQILAVLQNPKDLGLPAYANNNPEGFLFPAAYEVPDNPDATAMLKQMIAQYNVVAKELDLENRAMGLGLQPYDVLKIASYIEAEVKRDEDRPKVARAILNRLTKQPPMNLEMDTTWNYGANRAGHANLPDGYRTFESPYNTYKYPGLTPTPIDSPGKKSIEAALNPADGPWLFWVAVNLDTGETKFATTLEEHNKNVDEYRAWCKANSGKCTQ